MKALIAYVPALHRGYIDFFKKYPESNLYILGGDFLREFPRLERDLRALAPEEAKQLLVGLNLFEEITVLTKENLEPLARTVLANGLVVMPEDEVSRWFAEKYLPGKKVEFVPVFLRWDRKISSAEFEVPAGRVISENDLDQEMMSAAQDLSKKSPDWWRQIGAVLARGGKVILSGYNRPMPSEYSVGAFGDPRSNFDAGERIDLSKFIHAEAGLIAEAAKRGIALEGASIYVTTFPCPVCAKSVALSGIKKVYYSKGYSLLDAEDILRAYGVEIVLVK